MISVIEVYNTVRDLCNKDQKGFVTPSVFNTFAEIAQQNVFSEMFRELSGAKQLRARNLDLLEKILYTEGLKTIYLDLLPKLILTQSLLERIM